MRLIGGVLALSLCLLGCRAEPVGEPVELATAPAGLCFAYGRAVVLVAQPDGGVVARHMEGDLRGTEVPVIWPSDYVGRRNGLETVVYDPTGKERARTGMMAQLFDNYPLDAPGAVRATCLDVSMEPPGPAPRSSNVTLGDAD